MLPLEWLELPWERETELPWERLELPWERETELPCERVAVLLCVRVLLATREPCVVLRELPARVL